MEVFFIWIEKLSKGIVGSEYKIKNIIFLKLKWLEDLENKSTRSSYQKHSRSIQAEWTIDTSWEP